MEWKDEVEATIERALKCNTDDRTALAHSADDGFLCLEPSSTTVRWMDHTRFWLDG